MLPFRFRETNVLRIWSHSVSWMAESSIGRLGSGGTRYDATFSRISLIT